MTRHPAMTLLKLAAATGYASSMSSWASARTFTVVERATTDAVSVHAGAAADSVGDILTFSNDVFDAADQQRVGSDQGYCVRVIVRKSFECHWTLILSTGQISVDGPFFDDKDSVLAVTGGTGAFSGAQGDMRLHARDQKASAFDFVYTLK